jgi:flavin-binding protein dodecin
MSVAKLIELVGTSNESWEDAARSAVAEAAKTIRNITGVRVAGQTAAVAGNAVVEFRANVKVAFVVGEGPVA